MKLPNLTPLDILGRSVTLTTSGNQTYKTPFGAIMTLFCIFSVLIYGLVVSLRGSTEASDYLTFNIESLYLPNVIAYRYDPFTDPSFFMGLGFIDAELDPRIGEIQMSHKKVFRNKQQDGTYSRAEVTTKVPTLSCEDIDAQS
jgi:hypothetical protein